MQKQFYWKRNLILIWLTQVASLTGFGFVMPFLPQFIQELGVHDPTSVRVWTGVIAAAPALPMAIMAPLWGYIGDRYSKKLMIIRALVCATVIMFLMAQAKTVTQVFLLRIIQGALTGTITASTTLVASGTPIPKRARALGFYATSNFIGISIGPFLGGIIAEFFSFPVSFRFGALFLLLAAIIASIFVKEPNIAPEQKEKQGHKTSDGAKFTQRFARSLKSLLSRDIAVVLLLITGLRIVRTMLFPFIPLRVQELYEMQGITSGISSTTGIITAAIGAATALAAVFLNRLDKSLSNYHLFFLLFGTASIFCLFIGMQDRILWFAFFLVITMFFLGGTEPLMQSYISKKTPHDKQGVVFGLQTTVSSLGWFFAPLIGSAVSVQWDIAAIFYATSIILLLATTMIIITFERKREKID